jgi:succinate dehydrogenase hydrophobic anchor subunit
MQTTITSPKSGENTWLWLFKIFTGPVIIVILIIHFVVNHFIPQTGLLTYEDIVAYYRIPIVPIMEICLLAFVVSHSMVGLRSIILDLKPSRGFMRAVDWVFSLAGVAAVAYGIWLILVIVAKGR